jgi:enoyl-CoA hydratase/carnithine racemase
MPLKKAFWKNKTMQHLSLDHSPPVSTITLKNGGACTLDFIADFNAAIDAIQAFRGPACLIITGQGKSFSTGFHLDDFFSGDAALRQAMLEQSIRLLGRVAALPLATVAAMNGHTFGFGAMLALACDWRVMRSDRGYFCLPELDLKVAIPRPMMELLKLKLDRRVLRDLILQGSRIGAEEACRLGIVDETSPLEKLLDRAAAKVLPLADKDRDTLAAMKRELYRQFLDTIPVA